MTDKKPELLEEEDLDQIRGGGKYYPVFSSDGLLVEGLLGLKDALLIETRC